MKLLFSTFLLFIVTGSAYAGSKAAESEINYAIKVNHRCLSKYIDMLDDNYSGADVIAKAVVNSCGDEATFVVNELVRGVYPVDKQDIFNSMIEKNYSLALKEILRRRAAQGGNSSQKFTNKCEKKCEIMFKNGDLKDGMTLQKCIEILCN